MGGFRFLDHMTDAVIEATGSSLEEAFEYAALALTDTTVDLRSVRGTREAKINAKGTDLQELLFDWLDKVLLVILVDRIVLCKFKVRIRHSDNHYELDATAYGEPMDLNRHGYKVEIKAVTYHEMEVATKKDNVKLKFLLDL